MPKHFCILPWIHFQVAPTGDVFPCCRASDQPGNAYGSIGTSSIEAIWNGEAARKTRLAMLADQPVEACTSCYAREARGGTSERQLALKKFSHLVNGPFLTAEDGSVDLSSVAYIDFRLSNLCNFRCRSCGPKLSTSWYKEAVDLGFEAETGTLEARVDDLFERIAPTAKLIYFAGGEPLIMQSHYRLLERLIELGRTDVELAYNSNLSKLSYQKWDALELWSKFKKVEVRASSDGVGPAGELLRKGFDSEKFAAHYLKLREHGISVAIQCTVSVMNVFHITAALEEWIERGLVRTPEDYELGYLDEPSYLHLNILNERERSRVREQYEAFLKRVASKVSPGLHRDLKAKLADVLATFGQDTWTPERAKFRKATLVLDKLRKERFVRHFPEHLELLYEG